jgi:hypothetical protein
MGHNYEGNLEALVSLNKKDFNFRYLTFNKLLIKEQENFIHYQNIKNICDLLCSKVVIATHGILFHSLLKRRDIKTINIGHGIQTSNIDLSNSELNMFDEVWLSSKLEKEIFINDCNYPSSNIHITGFIKHQITLSKKLNSNINGNIIIENNVYWLYAPTATKANKKAHEDLFNINNPTFLNALNELSILNNCTTVIKPHFRDFENRNKLLLLKSLISGFSNLIFVEELNEEELKYLPNSIDVLITDWSSIFLDYLILDKPIIFLNSSKRRKNMTISKYFDNGYISRINSYEEIKKINIKNSKFRTSELKKYIFGDLNLEKINSRYLKRLENLID